MCIFLLYFLQKGREYFSYVILHDYKVIPYYHKYCRASTTWRNRRNLCDKRHRRASYLAHTYSQYLTALSLPSCVSCACRAESNPTNRLEKEIDKHK